MVPKQLDCSYGVTGPFEDPVMLGIHFIPHKLKLLALEHVLALC
jgi:hypothetical protein